MDPCIAFSSEEGRRLFKEALMEGHMEAFFPLAEQFTTQDEPAYCGLSTLTMVLNSLAIDPGRTWKGPWRWYHESMLDCCEPLDLVREKGITHRKLACLARCNGATADVQEASGGGGGPGGLQKFRDTVRGICSGDEGNAFLLLSYDRRELNQTGRGHFSPIGGFHQGRDMVLIMDVARFKYPPHWVSLGTAHRAMSAPDESTGRPRGYMVLRRARQQGVLFTVYRDAYSAWPEFAGWWRGAMSGLARMSGVHEGHVGPGCWCLTDTIQGFTNGMPHSVATLVTTHSPEVRARRSFSCTKISAERLLSAIEGSEVFQAISCVLAGAHHSHQGHTCAPIAPGTDLQSGGDCTLDSVLRGVCDQRHFLTALLLACVHASAMDLRARGREEDAGQLLARFRVMGVPDILKNEVENLSLELSALAKGHASPSAGSSCTAVLG